MEILLLPHKDKLKETITCVILCAGEGTRTKDIAINVPKPLLKVESLNNQSILSLIISNLIDLKFNQIVIVTGHLGGLIADFVNSSQIKNQNSRENILIHRSGDRYKLGPLYSFLSITKNNQIFKEDKLFMVFPGDTVFDFNLIQEIFDLIIEKYMQIINNSILFYRKIRTDILKKKYEKYYPKYEKSISYLKIEEMDSKAIVKEISQEKLDLISDQEEINQIIPIFIFNNVYVEAIRDLANSVKFRTIREAVNLLIEREKHFFAISVSPEKNFYDIDTPLDLKILNEKKKSGQ
ncbi:MAG: NTP transferase domain-containing protein [Candidatus Lokiarchaeota archaeon]|nr:NTP transferase domain-containing protein [Candidatus Lokiarchaeota archaeon]